MLKINLSRQTKDGNQRRIPHIDSSAIAMIDFVYRSWLKVTKGWIYEREGQERWLAMIKSDEQLVQECDRSLEEIKVKANEIINNLKPDEYKSTPSQLFDLYRDSEDDLARCAIAAINFL